MGMFRRTDTLERGDVSITNSTHRHHAGTHDLAAHDHCAGTALGDPTTEFRTVEPHLVVGHEQYRSFRINRYRPFLGVYLESNLFEQAGRCLLIKSFPRA